MGLNTRVCTHVLLAAVLSRALAPRRPLAGGEGGARRGSGGRVRWAVPPLRPRGLPHLTPTLSAPKGGEGDFGCQMCACPSANAGATHSRPVNPAMGNLTVHQVTPLLVTN